MPFKTCLKLAFLLAAAIFALASCEGSTPPPEPTPFHITPEALGDYTVVRRDAAVSTDGDYTSSLFLRDALDKKTGVKLKPAVDFWREGTGFVIREHEILVGRTNRDESKQIYALIDAAPDDGDNSDYIIAVVDEKIVIAAADDEGLRRACELFVEKYVADDGIHIFYALTDTNHYSRKQLMEEKLMELKKTALSFDPAAFGKITKLDAAKYPVPPAAPTKGEHPRLMFRVSDLDMIRERLNADENKNALAAHKTLCGITFDGKLDKKPDGSYNYDGYKLSVIESKAFEYALNGDETLGYEAINAIQNYILTATYDKLSDNYRAMGHVMMVAAEVYDWCYPLLDDATRANLVAGCESLLAPTMEIGFPPQGQGSVTGHGSEAQLLRDWLSFAIAVADEYPDVYSFVGGRLYADYVPPRNYYYASGISHQGTAYGPYRFVFDLYSGWLINRMGGGKLYSDDMARIAESYLYLIRPDGQSLRLGDEFNEKGTSYSLHAHAVMLFYSSNYFGDPVTKAKAKEYLKDFSAFTYTNITLTPTQFLIFNDPSIEYGNIEDLPLARYLSSPLGVMITRGGWEMGDKTSDETYVYMKIGEIYPGNHDHLDAGSFQIYHKGILASDSGLYSLYGTPHDYGYHKMTLAHNSLLIFDPNEKMANDRLTNTGGQRYLNENRDLKAWMAGERYVFGQVTGYEIGEGRVPAYTYLAGDITAAYTAKVSEVLRSMLYIPLDDEKSDEAGIFAENGVFVVFDKITASDPSFKKTFLLHMQSEPKIEGNITEITNKANGYDGRLVCQTLLPAAPSIEVIGGEDKNFVVNGENILPDSMPGIGSVSEYGWGRVEISPEPGSATDYFLNVMTIGGEGVPAAELIESDLVTGCKILGHAALFGKNAAKIDGTVEFTVSGEGAMVYNVAGLAAGEWTVTVGGADFGKYTASDDGGILYFTAPAGKVTLTKLN